MQLSLFLAAALAAQAQSTPQLVGQQPPTPKMQPPAQQPPPVQYQVIPAPTTPPVVQLMQSPPQVVQQYAAPAASLVQTQARSGTFTMGPGPISLSLARVGQAMTGLNKTHVWSWQHQVVRAAPPQQAYYSAPQQTYQVVQQAPPTTTYQIVQQAPPTTTTYQVVQQPPPTTTTYQIVQQPPVQQAPPQIVYLQQAPPRKDEDVPPPTVYTSPQTPGKK
jgi:hypothetical protein